MTDLSDESIQVLRKAGWTEGRSLDAREIERQYEGTGHTLNPPAIEFLRQFGDLVIKLPPKPVGTRFASSDCRFKMVDAVKCFPGWVPLWERMIRKQLVSIGYARQWTYNLLCADDGMIYKASESLLFLLGVDGNDAINALVDAQVLEQIEDVDNVWD